MKMDKKTYLRIVIYWALPNLSANGKVTSAGRFFAFDNDSANMAIISDIYEFPGRGSKVAQARKIYLIMGVSGVGKSTVAERLAQEFYGLFIEADAFHPAQNIEAMSAGISLNDDMRWSWLDTLCRHVRSLDCGSGEGPIFIACSALKRKYRDFMSERLGPLFIIHLDGDRELILKRLQARKGHFMPPELLDSQIGDLEIPSGKEGPCIRFDIAETVDKIVIEATHLIEGEWR